MTNTTLAESYLLKAIKRLKILEVLMSEQAYSDVVREAQEIVELALKGVLRKVGVEPPRWHDVSDLILEHRDRLPSPVSEKGEEIARISKWLRKEREFSFYGDIDFIPTEQYSSRDAIRAIDDAQFVVGMARLVIEKAG
jgi:HEPN domain-containing protein